MPWRFGTSGSVRASRIAKSEKCAHVRPHLLAGDAPRVAVALGPGRERREVGARARLAEELAPLLLVAHHRRQEAQALLLGAVREQRGRGVVQPERVQPAEVERPQLGVDRARDLAASRSRPPYATGQVGTTSPDAAKTGYHASYSARGAHLADGRRAAAPARVDPRARHVRLDPRAHLADGRIDGRVAIDVHRPSKRGARFSRNAASPSRKSSVRDDSSSANASFASCARASALAPACSSHFVSPSATVGPLASWSTTSSTAASSSRGRHGAMDRAPLGRLGAGERASEEQQLAGAHLADPARQQPGRAAVGREAALAERLPEAGVVGRDREVGGERDLESDAGGPAPHLAHDRHLHGAQQRDQPVGLRRAAGAGCCRRAACDRRPALRATMSAPPQKWSPAPSSR